MKKIDYLLPVLLGFVLCGLATINAHAEKNKQCSREIVVQEVLRVSLYRSDTRAVVKTTDGKIEEISYGSFAVGDTVCLK